MAELHPEDLKAEIRKRYGSLATLARYLGCSRSTLSAVIRSPGKSAPLERKIARALHKPPQEIWPGRWTLDGLPAALVDGRQRTRKPARQAGPKQREKGAAA
jgi:Ner family transcriptional regulator